MKTVQERIIAGEYANKRPYASIRTNDLVWEAYMNEDARLRKKFHDDLAFEHGVSNHPKEPRLFELAWKYGASDYKEVATQYADFVDLIQE